MQDGGYCVAMYVSTNYLFDCRPLLHCSRRFCLFNSVKLKELKTAIYSFQDFFILFSKECYSLNVSRAIKRGYSIKKTLTSIQFKSSQLKLHYFPFDCVIHLSFLTTVFLSYSFDLSMSRAISISFFLSFFLWEYPWHTG